MALPAAERRATVTAPGAAERLAEAGRTWEMPAGRLQGPLDAAAWEAVIPSMGPMALPRNPRNFDEAGVSDEAAARVAAELSDPAVVARSRQFPFRCLAANQHAPSLRWSYPLERALGHSPANVPALPGRTLILVDRSGGTDSSRAVREHYRGHDRVLIVTDEQATDSYGGDPTEQVPDRVPVHTWNPAGHRAGHGPSGTPYRHTFGGLSDAAFRMVPLLEAGRDAHWPWAA